ncbi:MAG: YidC/Oxa1 family membrane protein insertase, partial [Clostridiales bacterium]|nr:YidC/Oxa1 family membrane protein insertase [Clostridiales bacterium]
KSSRLQPKIQKIQKKYNIQGISDPRERQKAQQKMNEEMQDLYAREGHNPMQMGCGTMIFQMVFLMGIVGIIYYPLSYVINMPNIGDFSDELTAFVQNFLGTSGKTFSYLQLSILENWADMKSGLVEQFPTLFTPDKVADIEAFRKGMFLGGLDLTVIPHWKDGLIVLIPIFSLLTSIGSTIISTLIQRKNNPAAAQQMGSMIIMMLMMPLFSFYISFRVPAAVGFYWIVSNVVAIFQQLFIAKFYPPRKSQAKLMIENTIERRSREASVKKY